MEKRESQEMKKTESTHINPSKSGFKHWVKEHKLLVAFLFLLLILAGTVGFYQLRISSIKSQFATDKAAYQKQTELIYKTKIDSVNLDNAQRITKVFSWSVRAELLRGNKEQVNILMGQFIKTPGMKTILLIDPATKEILLSTDRKIEGERFEDQSFLANPRGEIINNRSAITISGLNDVMAYLYFEFNNLD